jgi:AraC family transcriptional regulator of arabinose operon
MKNDPLKPDHDINAHLVAGLTPIIKNNPFDFTFNRPKGIKGYIFDMTSEGQGAVFSGDKHSM